MASSLLAGVRVLSVGHTLPAMYCIPALCDLGADVTLIEAPGAVAITARYASLEGLFPTGSLLTGTSRCKVNLKNPSGRDAYLRMVRQADVVLEGFRPGASKRLGIDYDTVKGLNPRVIYAAISGYGQDAALRYGVGHDLNYLAASGVLHLTGDPGSVPAAPGAPFADGIAGLSAALNIVAALWRRTQNGDGCFLDIAIVDGPAFLMSMEYDYFRQTGDERQRGDTHLCSGYPWYHVFETADGRYLSVAAVEPHFFARLCHLLGRPDLATQQFVDGVERRALFQTFGAIFKSKSLNEWLEVLHGEDVCVAPVLTPGEATRGLHPLSDAGDATARGRSLIRLEASVASLPRETAATLASFGFAEEEVRALQEQGSIG